MSYLSFEECAIAIGLIFVVSYIVRKQYKAGRTNLIMFLIILMIVSSAIVDLGSVSIDYYGRSAPWIKTSSYIFNLLYFITRNLIAPLFVLYLYSSIDIWHIFTATKSRNLLWFSPVAVEMVIILLNRSVFNIFSITDDCKYQRGPHIVILYVISAFYAIWGVIMVVRYRKILNKDKFAVLLFMYVMILSGMVAQLVKPDFLIESFALVMSLLFFMVMVKREENQIDPITGATKYNEGLERVSKNFITHKPVSVILVKIANYNNITLYLGQSKYNAFLHGVTDVLRDISRECSFPSEIFYLESGLFAYLGEDLNDEVISEVANSVKEEFIKPLETEGFSVMADVRLCVVKCPEEIENFQTLFALGTTFHHTLPKTKEAHFYKDFCNDRDFKIRNEMNEILFRAIESNGFQMYYQPIYSTAENRFVAAEALIRLQDRFYGFISPSVFIPIAEATGAIHEIGDYVIRTVIKFISRIDMEELGLKYIEMNLSDSQCIEVDLVGRIQQLIEDNHINPSSLGLELTETAADINPEIVDNNIRRLHDYGVRIALDDYGTGYSNVKRVTTLPIDQVKLDKSFVDMVDDPQMWIVIQDTISMLKEMGKEVLVEGVEEERVARMFTDINTDLIQGCELIQGFYFCKPVPADEFLEFIRTHKADVMK
ncbi:MAG: EAL domain-containing protein [Lachnospiraceae bacterium]|nr:EAL domain-containing protein [Lachnospiraceae bacterium]